MEAPGKEKVTLLKAPFKVNYASLKGCFALYFWFTENTVQNIIIPNSTGSGSPENPDQSGH
ncbi:hypothetical protein CQP30_11710 [Yersinia pestis]|uniref:Uncharacterized protein n=1 Tax=Yersinia pseudotuberculosis TaxID=633 RepID=A0ABN5R3W4_YERPU|nr:hypothetical protein CEQ20_18365 [Yersinia pseudotuberculosis]AYW84364.1 hypothetical protein EGX42_16305 [Yersinia pestis]EDR55247.1 hypothetical protein YpMG051020_2850 [Yersinia pestis biovar Orientalis str. MG05-1020]OSZ89793.1 hypothetical protein A7725_08940 [Yersinia pestis subsp. microtus bv. Caucasica]OUY14430.1 hypothetical protein BFI40_11775 [Yersinia pestis subsp. microtus bv. Altaica]OVY74579.1 hypothetical protein BFI50_16495 [Yersinia pestis subsp. microtus bv. Xilingolensis